MSLRAAKAYANNDVQGGVLESDPVGLIALILERTIDHLKLGKRDIEQNGYGIDHFTKANDLIQKGLLACLDYDHGEDIAHNLAAIYEWSLREIIKGRVEKDPQIILGVIRVLTPIYEGWVTLTSKEPKHSVEQGLGLKLQS